MANTERLFIRISPELKEDIQALANENNLNISECIRSIIENSVYKQSHEQQIQHALQENTFINGLLTNPELTLKSKKIITKELRNYVGY